MATPSKMSPQVLKDIKEKVENAHSYFEDNYKRYHDYVKFVFKSSLTEADEETLKDLGKPNLEFNILESFVSRLRGEFAKQQPSLTVRAADGIPLHLLTPQFNETIKVIESHLRAVFFDASNDKLEYNIYSDLLAGGFSVLEVYTDYVNEMSMEQNIKIDRVFDPTLCGFDPLARDSHKGDGRFCFQIYPKTKKEFAEEYGKKKIEGMTFSKSINGFGWSYRDEKEDTVLVCDFYEKKQKKAKIVVLSNGETMLKKEYDKFLEEWEERGELEQPPIIVKERNTRLETIVRYRLCENEILDYVETNYSHLPLVFVDGNSAWITEGNSNYQMTRPYVYHAKGVQKLKNFAGQTLANELEGLVQHKFAVAIESIPEEYLEAYNNVQVPNTLIYNHFLDKNAPEVTLPAPREIQRTPIPPEITNTFRMSDEMTQVILGSYDSALGANRQEISGAAIAMGAMQSNNASVPYIVGYIKGLNRVAQILVDLIPKYYRTPRSLPILLPSGKRDYQIINAKDGGKQESAPLYMNYDPHSLQVKVETGVNFAMQKELALKTMINLMQASPAFAQFMNEEGLNALLDNIDIRGIDDLKAKAEKYEINSRQKQEKMGQMQQQMAKMQMQLNMQKVQAEVQKTTADAAKAMKEAQAPTKAEIDLRKLQQEGQFKTVDAEQSQEKIDIQLAELLSELQNVDKDRAIKMAQVDAEQARTAVETLHNLIQAEKSAHEIQELKEGSRAVAEPAVENLNIDLQE